MNIYELVTVKDRPHVEIKNRRFSRSSPVTWFSSTVPSSGRAGCAAARRADDAGTEEFAFGTSEVRFAHCETMRKPLVEP